MFSLVATPADFFASLGQSSPFDINFGDQQAKANTTLVTEAPQHIAKKQESISERGQQEVPGIKRPPIKGAGIDLSQYVMDEKEYFGFEESVIEGSSPVNFPQNIQDEGGSVNLSEYLDKAYDKFDPNYKIRFEDDEDDDA